MENRFNYWKTIFGLLNQIEHPLTLAGFDVRPLPNADSVVGLRVTARVCDICAEALVLLVDRRDGILIYYTTGGEGDEIVANYPESAQEIRALVRRVVDGVSGALSRWKRLFEDEVCPETEED